MSFLHSKLLIYFQSNLNAGLGQLDNRWSKCGSKTLCTIWTNGIEYSSIIFSFFATIFLVEYLKWIVSVGMHQISQASISVFFLLFLNFRLLLLLAFTANAVADARNFTGGNRSFIPKQI